MRTAAILIFVLLAASPAHASKSCMTMAEARTQFATSHLYWHGPNHCWDATAANFFGPTGVHPRARNKGVGKALLFACLEDMRAQGFAYAIIGGVGPAEFYAKAVGAVAIEGSAPGIYRGLL